MRKLRIIAILLALVFLVGCSFYPRNETPSPHEWITSELHKYWDSYADIESLDVALIASGFKYGNEFNDLNAFMDTAPPAEKTMSRGWANCNGWSRYFADFVKYKSEKGVRLVKNYEMFLLRNGLDWHVIVIFRVQTSEGSYYIEQSNLSLGKSISRQTILDNWCDKGFGYQEVVERWEVAN